MVFGREKRELIFAECKTGWPSEEKSEEKEAVRKRRRRELYNSFEKKDIQRMKKLAQSFPGAVIVFSTLNSTLGKSEKNLIRSLAMQGRRHWRDDRSYNPVLILTATELFADFKGLAHVWEEKGGRYADFARNRFDLHNILPLCDLTQQLYLDMPSWHEWRVERIERRRAIRAQRTASSEREALPSIP